VAAMAPVPTTDPLTAPQFRDYQVPEPASTTGSTSSGDRHPRSKKGSVTINTQSTDPREIERRINRHAA
jgi:hypothetical protein